MADDWNSGKKGGKGAWFSVRPIFLVAGAVALLAFGVIFGVSLDLATRPDKAPVAARPPGPAPKPSHQYVPPTIKIEPDANADPAPASIFDDKAAPPPQMPQHAWGNPEASKPPAEPAMKKNAVAVVPDARGAVLAVVIDDMGLDRPRALKIIALSGPLTLSMMTYANDLPGLVAQARKGGHEVMAHLPMEPMSAKENPGPGALMVNMDEETIRKTLAAELDGWQGYVGVNNHMGSRFTKDRERMAIVMDELRARGLLWLDSKTVGDSAGPSAARASGVPYLERDVFLDNEETVEAVTAQLEQLVATAKARGTAIGIGHPHDSTVAALRQWLPHLASRGIVLVPVTEILKRRSANRPPG
ncbi:MAG: divergent polysaccharide deacetylase family protein [Rhodospirillaceae bacterium]|nr:divergent polysaccharide deacetylase family protein [Rhodospirillaceae bacterium]